MEFVAAKLLWLLLKSYIIHWLVKREAETFLNCAVEILRYYEDQDYKVEALKD